MHTHACHNLMHEQAKGNYSHHPKEFGVLTESSNTHFLDFLRLFPNILPIYVRIAQSYKKGAQSF